MSKKTIKMEREGITQSAVHVEDMTIAYHDRPVIWDVDIEIPYNTRTCIIGPNGAGKSTFLKGILNLLNPLSGEVKILGKDYKDVYKRIAYIPQSGSVNWDFPTTVFDVVLMGRYIHLGWVKRPTREDKRKATEALEAIGMLEFKDRQISQLSGGQRQRVFLARAIAQDAEIYFMDEPLQGVDKKTEGVIMDTVKRFQAEGKTVIAVHHDLNTVEEYFDYVVMLNKKIVADGPVATTFTDENVSKAYGIKQRI